MSLNRNVIDPSSFLLVCVESSVSWSGREEVHIRKTQKEEKSLSPNKLKRRRYPGMYDVHEIFLETNHLNIFLLYRANKKFQGFCKIVKKSFHSHL